MDFFEKIEKKAETDGIIKRVAGGIIYNNEGKILLLQRKADDFYGGILELPSGNVEKNETVNEGLIREIKEETGLDVKEIGKFVNSFDYLSSSGKKSRQFNFEVETDNTTDIFLTEHDSFEWLSLDEIEINKKITNEVKYAIAISEYNRNKK